MAAAGMSMSYDRSQVIDFTYPYYEETLAFLLKVTNTKWYYFLEPLHWKSWISVLLLPACVYTVVWCFLYTTDEIKGRAPDGKFNMNLSVIISNMLLQGTTSL